MAEKQGKSKRAEWSVLAVQSAVGAVILLLALLARLAGGSVYEQLGAALREALLQETVIEETTTSTAPAGAVLVKLPRA